MKLLGSTENKIAKDKNGENIPHLEITEVVLVHCDNGNNDFQQDSRFVNTVVPNKPFGSLLEIARTNFIQFNSEKHLIQNFYVMKYGLQIKIATTRNRRQNKLNFSYLMI